MQWKLSVVVLITPGKKCQLNYGVYYSAESMIKKVALKFVSMLPTLKSGKFCKLVYLPRVMESKKYNSHFDFDVPVVPISYAYIFLTFFSHAYRWKGIYIKI